MSKLDFAGLKSRFDIDDFLADHLRKTEAGYECPHCGSGNGPKGTGALYPMPDGEHFHCNSCGATGDAFDLAGQLKDLETPVERYRYVADWLDLHGGGTVFAHRETTCPESDFAAARKAELKKVERWRDDIDDPDAVAYLAVRGISPEVARRFGLGYDSSRRRIVMPFPGNEYYHIDRAIDGTMPKYSKPRREDVGAAPLWNPDALRCDHFFVVEGPFDALAVEACGHPAVALTGTGHSQLVAEIREHGYDGELFILLDADDAGTAAARSLAEDLSLLPVGYCSVRMPESSGAKDSAELFQGDPSALKALLDSAVEYARDTRAGIAARASLEGLAAMGCRDTTGAAGRLLSLDASSEPVPTGIPTLDQAIGGLPRGLTVLGAASAVGKTAVCLAISRHLVELGYVCVYVSLEMSAAALVSRVVSSIAYSDSGAVISASTIVSETRRNALASREASTLASAVRRYDEELGPSLLIMNADHQPTATEVAEAAVGASAVAQATGKRGIAIVVDYLQLLAPMGDRLTERTAVDASVVRLQHVAHELNAPVIAISSLNRASYYGEVALDSMKESGGIEYAADLLLGLQPSKLAKNAQDIKAAGDATTVEAAARLAMHRSKCGPVRSVELNVLKNRNGAMPPAPVQLDFIASASTFIDVDADPAGHAAAEALKGAPKRPTALQIATGGGWGPGMPSDRQGDVA